MSSSRFDEALKLANDLPSAERIQLVRTLVQTLGEELALDGGAPDEWNAEIVRRLHDDAAGRAMERDELRAHVGPRSK
jgi:putative addiction module component (TIGR02574 family)